MFVESSEYKLTHGNNEIPQTQTNSTPCTDKAESEGGTAHTTDFNYVTCVGQTLHIFT